MLSTFASGQNIISAIEISFFKLMFHALINVKLNILDTQKVFFVEKLYVHYHKL